jgi:hypothetical protein
MQSKKQVGLDWNDTDQVSFFQENLRPFNRKGQRI